MSAAQGSDLQSYRIYEFLPWYQVEYNSFEVLSEYPSQYSLHHVDINSIKIYENDEIVFDLNIQEYYPKDVIIKEGQQIIIERPSGGEILINFDSLRFYEIDELPNVTVAGDDLFSINF